MDCLRSPPWILSPDSQDQQLHFLRCPCGGCVRLSASVCEGLACCVAFFPLQAGPAGDAKFPAQGTEVFAVHGCLRKFSSLVFHSFTLPRHLNSLLFVFSRCLNFTIKLYTMSLHNLYTMLLLCTYQPPETLRLPKHPVLLETRND